MSNCPAYAYPGMGEWAKKNFSYIQAIRVGDRIVCAGQGGWDCHTTESDPTGTIPEDINTEIDQAFANVDHNLKHAGGKGWSQVYRVVTYSTSIPEQSERIIYNLRKWMPNHYATWTELGVKELGLPTMRFEIDVEAYDEEGAAEVRKARAAHAG